MGEAQSKAGLPLTREDIVAIVQDVQRPLHEENQKRFQAIDTARSCDAAQLQQANDNISILQANDVRHESRFTRIEANIEALVGSATIKGMIPKLSEDLQSEFTRSSSFRHDLRGTLESMLNRMMLIEKNEARYEGEEIGREKVQAKVADWIKWLAGGIGAVATASGMRVLEHYLGWH